MTISDGSWSALPAMASGTAQAKDGRQQTGDGQEPARAGLAATGTASRTAAAEPQVPGAGRSLPMPKNVVIIVTSRQPPMLDQRHGGDGGDARAR